MQTAQSFFFISYDDSSAQSWLSQINWAEQKQRSVYYQKDCGLVWAAQYGIWVSVLMFGLCSARVTASSETNVFNDSASTSYLSTELNK